MPGQWFLPKRFWFWHRLGRKAVLSGVRRLLQWGGEIRRRARQEKELTTFRLNGQADPRDFMGLEIIHDHNLSGMKTGSQDLFNIHLKGCCVGRSFQDQRGAYAFQGACNYKRCILVDDSRSTSPVLLLAHGQTRVFKPCWSRTHQYIPALQSEAGWPFLIKQSVPPHCIPSPLTTFFPCPTEPLDCLAHAPTPRSVSPMWRCHGDVNGVARQPPPVPVAWDGIPVQGLKLFGHQCFTQHAKPRRELISPFFDQKASRAGGSSHRS